MDHLCLSYNIPQAESTMPLHCENILPSHFVTAPLNLGEQFLLTNCKLQNQLDFLTKKVKNLDKRNSDSREGFSVWHEAKC